MVRQGGDFRIVPAGFRIAAKNSGGAGRGGSVRFGEDDIEGDRGRTGFGQGIGQPGDVSAGPRPLPETTYGLVVDVNDANSGILIGPGIGTLIAVEDQIADLAHHRGLEHVQDEQQQGHGQTRPRRRDIARKRQAGARQARPYVLQRLFPAPPPLRLPHPVCELDE